MDGSYYVVETAYESKDKFIVACGGWSKRRTLFGSDEGPNRDSSLLDPARNAAKIRAFFVHPDWVRRGLARRILRACEEAARGYSKEETLETPLGKGLALNVARMSKRVG